MKKIEQILSKILGIISVISILGIIASVLIQIIGRALLPQAPAWTEEVSRFFFVSGVFYTAGLAKEKNAFVSVDILEQKLQSRAKQIYMVIVDLIIIAFMAIVFVESIGFTQSGADFIADTVPINMNLIYFGTMVSSFFIVLYSIFDIVNTLMTKNEQVGEQK